MVMITSMRTSRAHMLTGGWQLIPMDHHFLSVYSPLLMLLTREKVLSPRTLRTYSNTRCMVFGMDTSVLAPTPSPWYKIDSLGENSLFLGQNYPMMVKGDPTVVDTFMRSNCVYTSDIWVVPYPSTNIVGRFSLDDRSCVGLQIDNGWPVPENHLWFKASVSDTA